MESNKIVLFEGNKIRRVMEKGEWWFVVEDIVRVLAETSNPKDYFNKILRRDEELSKGYGQIVHTLWVLTSGGRQKMNCASTAGILRIVQSIPSPKAEPFKRWLAQVGYERIQEVANPELAQERMKTLYEQKGYSKDWIEKRLRGIAVRQELTDEWKARGVEGATDFAILSAEISKATFGLTPHDYKKYKGLQRENLRDHMTDLELIFSMLGEKSTTEIHQNEDSKGLPKLKNDAKAGGDIAGIARKALEKKLGRPVTSKKNYLKEPENRQLLESH